MVTIRAEDQASSQIEGLSTKSAALGAAIGTTLGSLASQGIQAAASAVVDFGKESLQTGMNFDQAMSQVAATMGVTTADIGDLTACAKEMGATTSFSATEAAEALNYMALAGYDSETSMAMLPGVLNLAAAGAMDLGSASDMVTDSQTALGLSIDETGQLIDQMAQTSSKSNTSVAQLGDAILTVGGTAKNLSGGMTEMNTVLGVMADNGIKGSEAGTHLRNVILSLSAPTDTASAALAELGVSATDAEGNLRPIPDVMHDLNLAMANLSQEEKNQALTKIFNKTDLASVNALLYTSANNVEEIGQALLNTGVGFQFFDDSTLSAQEQANGMAAYISNALGVMGGDIDAVARKISEEFGLSFEDAKQLVQATADVADMTTDRFDELAEAIENSAGAAEKMAQTQLDNLAGDMTLLQSAVEGVQIEIAGMMTPALREMVQTGSDGLSQMAAQLQAGDLRGGFETLGETAANVAAVFLEAIPSMIDAGLQMIGGLLQGIGQGLPQIMTSLAEAVVGLVQAVLDNVPQIIQAGLALIQGLATGLLQAIPVLVSAIPDIITSLVDALVTGIPMIAEGAVQLFHGIIEAIPSIVEAVTAALPELVMAIGVGLVSCVDAIITAAVTLFTGMVQAFPMIISAIAQALPMLIEGIVSALVTLVPMLVEAGVTLFTGLVSNIGAIISAIAGVIPELIAAIVELIIALAPLLVEAGIQLLVALGEGLMSAVEMLGPVIESIGQFFAQLPERIGAFLTQVVTAFLAWIGELAAGAAQVGSQVIEAIVTFFSELPGKVGAFLSELVTNIGSWVADMASKAAEVGPKVIDKVTEFFSQLPGKIASFLSEVISNVVSWVSEMASNAVEAGSQFLQGVSDQVSQLPGEFAGWLADIISNIASWVSDMGAKAIEAGTEFLTGITGKMEEVLSFMASVPGNIISALGDTASMLFSAGMNIIQGLINGITSMIGTAISTVTGAVSNIVGAVTGALGIHSPSTVFAEIGEFMMAGLAVGEQRGAREPLRVMETLADSLEQRGEDAGKAWADGFAATSDYGVLDGLSLPQEPVIDAAGIKGYGALADGLLDGWGAAESAWEKAPAFFDGVASRIGRTFGNLSRSIQDDMAIAAASIQRVSGTAPRGDTGARMEFNVVVNNTGQARMTSAHIAEALYVEAARQDRRSA